MNTNTLNCQNCHKKVEINTMYSPDTCSKECFDMLCASNPGYPGKPVKEFERLSPDVVLIDGKHYKLMEDSECAKFIWGEGKYLCPECHAEVEWIKGWYDCPVHGQLKEHPIASCSKEQLGGEIK